MARLVLGALIVVVVGCRPPVSPSDGCWQVQRPSGELAAARTDCYVVEAR